MTADPRAALGLEARRPPFFTYLLVPLLYLLGARLGVVLSLAPEGIALLWPPNGVLLSVFVAYEGRGWARFSGLALLAELAADTGVFTLTESAIFGAANVLEATVAWLLLRRWRFDAAFGDVRDVALFVLAGPILGALCAAFVGAAVYSAFRGAHTSYFEFARIWWFGDGLGLLIFAPLLLGFWYRGERVSPPYVGSWLDVLVTVAGVATLALVVGLAESGLLGLRWSPPLVLPFLLYAAARFPMRWVCAVIAVVSVGILWNLPGEAAGMGAADARAIAVDAQQFVLIMSVMSLGLAALLGQLRAANELLRRRAIALEQSMSDIQRVAWVASHDLQTPLRSITGFSQLLLEAYGGRLGPQADDWIRRIVESTGKLQALIRGLLAYTSIDLGPTKLEVVDLNHVVDEVFAQMCGSFREQGGDVRRGDLPSVRGDRAQLTTVIRELVQNALAFRGQAPPTVSVTAGRRGPDWIVCVRDNGVGVAPEDQARIFEPFHRLHARADQPGAGVGLAYCARVVHRHGGTIGVDSTPGVGSTFYFSIPAHRGIGARG